MDQVLINDVRVSGVEVFDMEKIDMSTAAVMIL